MSSIIYQDIKCFINENRENVYELMILSIYSFVFIKYNTLFNVHQNISIFIFFVLLRMFLSRTLIIYLSLLFSVVIIAFITPYNFSPDESTHLLALDYYNSTRILPPLIGSPEAELASVPHYKSTYLYLKDIVYKIYGKAGLLLNLDKGQIDFLWYRMFVLAMFSSLLYISYRFRFHLVIICSMFFQFVYVFTYFNGEFLSIFLSVISLILLNLIVQEKELKNVHIFSLSILLGLMLFVRTNFYLVGLYTALITLYYIYQKSENNQHFLNGLFLLLFPGFVIGVIGLIPDILTYGMGDICQHGVGKCEAIIRHQSDAPFNRNVREEVGFWKLFSRNHYDWIRSTFSSLVGCFGYMQYSLSNIYSIVTGIIFFFFLSMSTYQKPKSFIILLVFLLSSFLLSFYFSWSYDYQPQGRYVLPGIIIASHIICNNIQLNGMLKNILTIHLYYISFSAVLYILKIV